MMITHTNKNRTAEITETVNDMSCIWFCLAVHPGSLKKLYMNIVTKKDRALHLAVT